MANAKVEEFFSKLDEIVKDRLGSVAYGNLRCEVSRWSEDTCAFANVAIAYDTPGGSTDQINITVDESVPRFHVVNETEDIWCEEPAQALQFVQDRIRTIPTRRTERLGKWVDDWLAKGHSRRRMFSEVNEMLQSDFRGGSITHREMQEVIRHIIERVRDTED